MPIIKPISSDIRQVSVPIANETAQDTASCVQPASQPVKIIECKSFAPSNEVTKEKSKIRSFDRKLPQDIQVLLKSKKPDITAAIVFQTIVTWVRSIKQRNYGNRVEGAVYQSLKGLQRDIPFLNTSTIQRAIGRLEKAFKGKFIVHREGNLVMNFTVHEDLLNEYCSNKVKSRQEGSAPLYFNADDAASYGIVAAVLIQNLKYKTKPKRPIDSVTDEHGNIYGRMSASLLTNKEKKRSDGSIKYRDGLFTGRILPFSRKAVQQSISELKKAGVFVESPEHPGFYHLKTCRDLGGTPQKNLLPDATPCNQTQHDLSPDAIAVEPNATHLLPNAMDVSPEATIYSSEIREQIEIGPENADQNPDSKSQVEIEYGKAQLSLSPAAPAPTALDELKQTRDNDHHNPEPDQKLDSSINHQGPLPLTNPTVIPSEGPKPLFLVDTHPHIIAQSKRNLELYEHRKRTGQLYKPVPNSELYYDIMIDPIRAGWVQEELDISPITGKPVDYRNLEEIIDIKLHLMEFKDGIGQYATKSEIQDFRDLFKRYPSLSGSMINTIWTSGHADTTDGLAYHDESLTTRQYDRFYWRRRIRTIAGFIKHFEDLFIETFAPFICEDGKLLKIDGKYARLWTAYEYFGPHGAEYAKTSDVEAIQEPFRTIFNDIIQQEKEELDATRDEDDDYCVGF